MQDLVRFYKAVGADAMEVVGRLGGMPDLVKRFLGKFHADRSFYDLEEAFGNDDKDKAFLAAHTLKGTCANLGIQSLFTPSSAITELLRAGKMEEAKVEFPALKREYLRVLDALKELGV